MDPKQAGIRGRLSHAPLHARARRGFRPIMTWVGGGLLGCTLTIACIVRTQADVDAHERTRRVASPPSYEPPVEPIVGTDGPADSAHVLVDIAQRAQTLEGFGASVAWYAERIVGQTPAETYPLLFADLGLDILRLRNRFERSDPSDGLLEQEVEIVKRASRALGYAPKILLSSWSPPAALKANGKERCGSNANCTLKKQNGQFVYAAFAQWWRRSLEHYAQLGIHPDLVSLQNEPDFIPPDWEGCKFEAVESDDYPGYGPALQAVHQALQGLPHPPRMIGPEVLGIHYQKLPNYLAHLDVNLLDGVAHHTYERGNDEVWDWRDPGPDSFNDEMAQVALAAKAKPLLQTEFGTDEDRGRDGGFETAWMIHNSLVVEGVSAWLYWDLIWPSPRGLVSMQGKQPKPRDQYYALRHYARYTERGDVRVAATTVPPSTLAPALRTSAFVAPSGKRLTVIVLNTSAEPLDAVVETPHFQSTKSSAVRTIFRPGGSRRWESMSPQASVSDAGDPRVTLRLPSRAVATFVFER